MNERIFTMFGVDKRPGLRYFKSSEQASIMRFRSGDKDEKTFEREE